MTTTWHRPKVITLAEIATAFPGLADRHLPAGWRMERGGRPHDDGAWFRHAGLGLFVIESFAVEADGRRWQHVSVSRRSRIPSWEDMRLAHRLFIGEDVAAYQCHVPRAQWVNLHPHVLHLWACLDAPAGVLPDFTQGSGSI